MLINLAVVLVATPKSRREVRSGRLNRDGEAGRRTKATRAHRRVGCRHAVGKGGARRAFPADAPVDGTQSGPRDGGNKGTRAGTVAVSASNAGCVRNRNEKQKASGTTSETFPGGFNHGLE